MQLKTVVQSITGTKWELNSILVHSALLTHINCRIPKRKKKTVLRLNKASRAVLSCGPVLLCIVSFDCKMFCLRFKSRCVLAKCCEPKLVNSLKLYLPGKMWYDEKISVK